MTTSDPAISEQGMCEEEQVARIAWFHYHDGPTQNEISDRLGPMRLKVSWLLEKGHQSGIIRVQIGSHFGGYLEYETQLRHQFSLQHIRVTPKPADADVGGRPGIGTAHILMSLLQPQQILAIGFGEATTNTLQHLSGFTLSQQTRLVTLSGGTGSYTTGIEQLNAACSVNIIPAPLRVSPADITRTLKNESCVKDVLLAAQAVGVAIVDIGAVSQQGDATAIRFGYISQGEQLIAGRRGAVDDILGCFFDVKGDIVAGIKIHNELIGLLLNVLKTILVRVGMVGEENKAEAIVVVMRGGYTSTPVTDQDTAAAILRS